MEVRHNAIHVSMRRDFLIILAVSAGILVPSSAERPSVLSDRGTPSVLTEVSKRGALITSPTAGGNKTDQGGPAKLPEKRSLPPHEEDEDGQTLPGKKAELPHEAQYFKKAEDLDNMSFDEGLIDVHDDTDESADAALQNLGEFYAPKGGNMSVLLKQLRQSDKKLNKAARTWTNKSHAAIQAAHHTLTRSAMDASTVFLRDGQRYDNAQKQNLRDETAKMDALALDGDARYAIIKEHGNASRLLLPPPDDPNSWIGKKVMCNSEYQGKNKALVHNQRGKIVAFNKWRNKWRVQLFHPRAKAFMPMLTHHEFTLLDDQDQDEDEELPPPAPLVTPHSQEWEDAMKEFGGQQVVIDHVPPHLLMGSNAFDEKDFLHKTGKIVNFRHEQDLPEFQIELGLWKDWSGESQGQFESSGQEKPWLVLDRDFHIMEHLKGKSVMVRRAKEGKPGDKGYTPEIRAEGVVQGWHTDQDGNAYYEVKIPEHIVKVQPSEIKRDRQKWWSGDELIGDAPPENALVGCDVKFTDPETKDTMIGKIQSYTAGTDDVPARYEIDAYDKYGTGFTAKEYNLARSEFIISGIPTVNKETRILHGDSSLIYHAVTFTNPEDRSTDPQAVKSMRGIVIRPVGNEQEHMYEVKGEYGNFYQLTYPELALLHEEELVDFKVEFNDPENKATPLKGTITDFFPPTGGGEVGLYKVVVSNQEGTAYDLKENEFRVTDFPPGVDPGIEPGPKHLLGKEVTFTDEDKKEFEGTVTQVLPNQDGLRPSVYTYEIDTIEDGEETTKTVSHAQITALVPEKPRAWSEYLPGTDVHFQAKLVDESAGDDDMEAGRIKKRECCDVEDGQVAEESDEKDLGLYTIQYGDDFDKETKLGADQFEEVSEKDGSSSSSSSSSSEEFDGNVSRSGSLARERSSENDYEEMTCGQIAEGFIEEKTQDDVAENREACMDVGGEMEGWCKYVPAVTEGSLAPASCVEKE